jgi:NADP-dependent 3-hydroxy acid dehydrogenase YdfG
MTRQTYDPRNGTMIVTGASSGIGEAIVRQLAAAGRDVVAVARREDRLDALAAETGCRTACLDIRDTDAVDALVRDVRPSVIVNNAGVAHGMAGLTATGDEDIRIAIETNVIAPLHLIRAAIPLMKEAGGGHIITLGSISGLYPLVSSLYCASKGAMHRATQTLRMEVRGMGIRVSEIAPGRTETELFDAANVDTAARDRDRTSRAEVEIMTPDDIAAAVMFALDAPLHVNIGLIELTPTEQAIGGATFTPYAG